MKKIDVKVLTSCMAPEDSQRFCSTVVARLREMFPGVIVHTVLVPDLRVRLIVYVYGFFGEEDHGQSVVEKAAAIVEEMISGELSQPVESAEEGVNS